MTIAMGLGRIDFAGLVVTLFTEMRTDDGDFRHAASHS